MIPVSVITGFLGSGKTTLLGRALRQPGFKRVAVIINEFGEIGIDHQLVESSDENFVQLTTGCLCCRVRSDLILTLHDLAARRAEGSIMQFDRVVIETSGLADPASILQALMTDPAIAETYTLAGVVTMVDSVVGIETLDQHRQSLRQAAAADHLVITKTDLPQERTVETQARLAALNPAATISVSGADGFDIAKLLEPIDRDPLSRLAEFPLPPDGPHSDDIVSMSYQRDEPLHAATLAMFLEALAENCSSRLLRFKGIVHVKERPANPAVVHGVQHVFHPPVWLEHWPSDDRRTRMVFIGASIPRTWIINLLNILDEEVAEETARWQTG